MRRGLLCAVSVLSLASCISPATSDDFAVAQTKSATGPRIELRPGEIVEVPIVLRASGDGETLIDIVLTQVSHGGEAGEYLDAALRTDGDVGTAPGSPLRINCAGNCRGDNLLTMSLSANAPGPVAVDWSLWATAFTKGTRLDDFALEVGEAVVDNDWTVLLEAGTTSPLETVGRLHLTGRPDSEGVLRLEIPSVFGDGDMPMVISEGLSALTPAPGTWLDLAPPEGSCDQNLCDWSVPVSAVTPWRVVASNDDFAASFSASEDGLLKGELAWTEALLAGESIDRVIEIKRPAGEGTDVIVAVLVSRDEGGRVYSRLPGSVSVQFGSAPMNRIWVVNPANRVLVSLDCTAETCQGDVPLRIDASGYINPIDVRVQLIAMVASTIMDATEIELERRQ